jgi:hypothetical protein
MRTIPQCILAVALLVFPLRLARAQDRIELNVHASVLRLPELGETPVGVGVGFSYTAFFPLLSFDAEVNRFPTHPAGNFGATEGFFGLRAGIRVRGWGLFAKLRPGFIRFEDGGSENRLTSRTQFAMDVGGGVEYDFLPHLGMRVDLAEVIIPFGNTMLLTGPGTVGVPLGTQHNFQATIGAMVHF